jgi:NAD(P)-dependent dehydrogenase (short-subunit alcohol dehydrogenase family)
VVVAGRTVDPIAHLPGTIDSVADEVRAEGVRALPVRVDVTVESEIEAMVSASLDEFGGIDILVNNAGVIVDIKPFWEVTTEEWERILAVDVTGTFLCCKHVVPHMIERQAGKIINIGSIQARQGLRGQAPYGACKAAVHNLTLALAKDVARYNINVTCVAPGAVKTFLAETVSGEAMSEEEKEAMYQKVYARYSLFGREVTPEDIGNAVVFLASEESRNVNGSVIYVEGGQPLKGE